MATAVAHTANKVDSSSSDCMITVPLSAAARSLVDRLQVLSCVSYVWGRGRAGREGAGGEVQQRLRAQGANVVAVATDIHTRRSTLLSCRFSWFSDRIIETMSTKLGSKAAKHSAQGKSNAPQKNG